MSTKNTELAPAGAAFAGPVEMVPAQSPAALTPASGGGGGGGGGGGFHYSYQDVVNMAAAIVQGGLFQQFNTPAKALSLMLLCQAKGLHPMTAVERYDVINGRPAMKTVAMFADFQAQGGRVQWGDSSDESVTGTFTFPAGGSITVTWDKARAVKAKLWSKPGPWQEYPQAMLRNRCIAEAIRAIAPGIVLGIYSEDEVRDMPPLPPPPAPEAQRQPQQANRSLPPARDSFRRGAPEPAPAPEAKGWEKFAAVAAEWDVRCFAADGRALSNERTLPLLRKLMPLPEGVGHVRDLTDAQWAEAARLLPDYLGQTREETAAAHAPAPNPAKAETAAPAPAPPAAPAAPEPDPATGNVPESFEDLDDPFAEHAAPLRRPAGRPGSDRRPTAARSAVEAGL